MVLVFIEKFHYEKINIGTEVLYLSRQVFDLFEKEVLSAILDL